MTSMPLREFFVYGVCSRPLTGSCRLRLAMYKGLGFEPIVEKDGRISKMLVRQSPFQTSCGGFILTSIFAGAESGDVHRVTFDEKKPEAEYTDMLWKLAVS